MWIQRNVFSPPVWIGLLGLWSGVNSPAWLRFFHHLAWACYWASKPSQRENQTRSLTLDIEIPWVGLPCAVAYHLHVVTDIVLSDFVRNRLRVQGKKNGSKDRTLGNTIFQEQRRRVYVSRAKTKSLFVGWLLEVANQTYKLTQPQY